MSKAASDLETLLDELKHVPAKAGKITLASVLEATGRRSFGPALLVPGLLVLSPLGGVPGVATSVGLLVVMVAFQLLIGRQSFWLPRWLLQRQMSAASFKRGLKSLRRPARIVDRFIRPRLHIVLHDPVLKILVIACAAMGLLMPAVEVIPFADMVPGAAITALGLALIAHDGVCGLVAAVLCFGTLGIALVAII